MVKIRRNDDFMLNNASRKVWRPIFPRPSVRAYREKLCPSNVVDTLIDAAALNFCIRVIIAETATYRTTILTSLIILYRSFKLFSFA